MSAFMWLIQLLARSHISIPDNWKFTSVFTTWMCRFVESTRTRIKVILSLRIVHQIWLMNIYVACIWIYLFVQVKWQNWTNYSLSTWVRGYLAWWDLTENNFTIHFLQSKQVLHTLFFYFSLSDAKLGSRKERPLTKFEGCSQNTHNKILKWIGSSQNTHNKILEWIGSNQNTHNKILKWIFWSETWQSCHMTDMLELVGTSTCVDICSSITDQV